MQDPRALKDRRDRSDRKGRKDLAFKASKAWLGRLDPRGRRDQSGRRDRLDPKDLLVIRADPKAIKATLAQEWLDRQGRPVQPAPSGPRDRWDRPAASETTSLSRKTSRHRPLS